MEPHLGIFVLGGRGYIPAQKHHEYSFSGMVECTLRCLLLKS